MKTYKTIILIFAAVITTAFLLFGSATSTAETPSAMQEHGPSITSMYQSGGHDPVPVTIVPESSLRYGGG